MFDYQAPENHLQDPIILVTGAGAGIGRAAAKAYAAHGATVILLGRTLEKLEQVYDEIEAAGHPQPALVPLNLESAQEHDYIELANTLEQEFGRLDGILHNASLLGVRTTIESYDPDFDAAFRALEPCINRIHLIQRRPKSQSLLGRIRHL